MITLPSSMPPIQFTWHFCHVLFTLRHKCTSCFDTHITSAAFQRNLSIMTQHNKQVLHTYQFSRNETSSPDTVKCQSTTFGVGVLPFCWRCKQCFSWSAWSLQTLLSKYCLWIFELYESSPMSNTMITLLCTDTGCRLEDFLKAMNDRYRWQESQKNQVTFSSKSFLTVTHQNIA